MKELDHIPCFYIGRRLRWLGIQVTDMKEKYGSWRVYCNFSIHSIHDITHNGYAYVQYKGIFKSLYYKTTRLQSVLLNFLVNWWLIPLQRRWYTKVYTSAVKKFPKEAHGIVVGADYWKLIPDLVKQYCKQNEQL
jgi:hypothetical protein